MRWFVVQRMAVGLTIVAAIVVMIIVAVVHPPVASTSMRTSFKHAFILLAVTLVIVTLLVRLQLEANWLLGHMATDKYSDVRCPDGSADCSVA